MASRKEGSPGFDPTAKNIIELTDGELWFIAGMDYNCDMDRHYAALKNLLLRGGVVDMATDVWYPYEVIELGANHLIPGHHREFAACLLLVLKNVKAGKDLTKDLEEYIGERLDLIDSLESDLKQAILDEFLK